MIQNLLKKKKEKASVMLTHYYFIYLFRGVELG